MKSKILIICLAIACILSGCKKEGPAGKNSLVNIITEPKGVNCSSGGLEINSGLDINSNNILESDEIQATNYLCNGNDGNIYSDNLVRLNLNESRSGTISTNWTPNSPYVISHLPDFNKNDYTGVDSMVFVTSMVTLDPTNKCFVQLYNFTDSVAIENSVLETNSTTLDYHYSGNIYNYLPSKKITIGIRFKSEHDGKEIGVGDVSYLYIYRHKK